MNALFVARRSTSEDGWAPIGRLDYDGDVYRFCYTHGARSMRDFLPFPGMENLEFVYESKELFPIFANRLFPRSRPQYRDVLRWIGSPDEMPDPIMILGITEGIRQTDSYEVFPCPVPRTDGCYVNRFFLHGLRHMTVDAVVRVEKLQKDQPLEIIRDEENPSDANAAAVVMRDPTIHIGYVPRYLAADVWRLHEACGYMPELSVERVNSDAPLQQRLLCKMRACWPDGFKPCSDDSFQPIPENVPAHCS